MHNTIIILKEPNQDGLVKLIGPIERIRIDSDIFEHSYIKLFSQPIIYICEMQTVLTRGDRINVNNIGEVDEIKRIRKMWDEYKSGNVKYSASSFVEPELRYSAKH